MTEFKYIKRWNITTAILFYGYDGVAYIGKTALKAMIKEERRMLGLLSAF